MNDVDLQKIVDAMEAYKSTTWAQFPDIELYMDQVITYLKQQLDFFHDSPHDNLITHSIINNYVKSGLVERPIKKKYAKPHLARLIMACILKRVMPIEQVKRLTREGGSPASEAFYGTFADMHEQVLREEAASLRALEMNAPDALSLALRFALKANTDRMIADRILQEIEGATPSES